MDKDLAVDILTISSSTRDGKGKRNSHVKALLESRFLGKNIASVIFTEDGIKKLESDMHLTLKEGDELKVVFKPHKIKSSKLPIFGGPREMYIADLSKDKSKMIKIRHER